MVLRFYPALEIRWPSPPSSDLIDRLVAALDDESPNAVEERDLGVRVFFTSIDQRDRAGGIAQELAPEAEITATSVSDEAWAERSQASLTPIRAGRFVITPPWARASIGTTNTEDVVITIVPSMGFGTGHHASTRLCLTLMQDVRLDGRSVLDVGTGSGVLAIAAWRLGAGRVLAVDVDTDALTSARENVELNGAEPSVELRAVDIAHGGDAVTERFDLVVANLTGGMLERHAHALTSFVAAGGALIVSGFQEDEEPAVLGAFSPATAHRRSEEHRWVALELKNF